MVLKGNVIGHMAKLLVNLPNNQVVLSSLSENLVLSLMPVAHIVDVHFATVSHVALITIH